MSRLLSRRTMIRSALAASGLLSASGAAAFLARRYELVPPDHGGLYGAGETLTYAVHRILLSRDPLAREFRRSQLSKNFPAFGTTLPRSLEYLQLMADGFEEWRLPVEGLVERPYAFSLEELRQFPARTQITQHVCEEGWSAIGEWTGAPLSSVLGAVRALPEAKFVVFHCMDGDWGSLDMADARHPQTLLAYGMNGGDLPVPHGAPVRLRVERQLGYKSLKYLSHVAITDSLKNIGKGLGGADPEAGYSWYAGI